MHPAKPKIINEGRPTLEATNKHTQRHGCSDRHTNKKRLAYNIIINLTILHLEMTFFGLSMFSKLTRRILIAKL